MTNTAIESHFEVHEAIQRYEALRLINLSAFTVKRIGGSVPSTFTVGTHLYSAELDTQACTLRIRSGNSVTLISAVERINFDGYEVRVWARWHDELTCVLELIPKYDTADIFAALNLSRQSMGLEPWETLEDAKADFAAAKARVLRRKAEGKTIAEVIADGGPVHSYRLLFTDGTSVVLSADHSGYADELSMILVDGEEVR